MEGQSLLSETGGERPGAGADYEAKQTFERGFDPGDHAVYSFVLDRGGDLLEGLLLPADPIFAIFILDSNAIS